MFIDAFIFVVLSVVRVIVSTIGIVSFREIVRRYSKRFTDFLLLLREKVQHRLTSFEVIERDFNRLLSFPPVLHQKPISFLSCSNKNLGVSRFFDGVNDDQAIVA